MDNYLEEFTRSYLATAQWSSGDGEHEYFDNFGWSEHAKKQAAYDCQIFIDKINSTFDKDIARYILNRKYKGLLAPHDFWLTRAGHGAGFWDGDWDGQEYEGETSVPDLGDRLTEISKSFPYLDVYLGDDNLLYFF